ncbi:limonene-1,2-epoxide hydrolase family protein [Sandaracinus amylolyticus]|uniref:Limonene-1,2-epoxide hydrolase domain-containing protein n=1 Tax=Sandaracinus amylolyticus TaxID=927083 RepID=A0A0F6VYT4_9BACT|nr:limonene-1,2-epoxide hydrolase family protein [Sandaracinus amylolyticus]AKF03080.1 hypothetical protein DB32_000229 [Sandaracinus amylolyticus]
MAAPKTQTSSGSNANIRVVQSFIDALTAFDIDRALSMMSDDVVYQNVPLPPDRGRAQVERTLRLFGRVARELEIRVHHIAENDGVVLTERTDLIRGPALDLAFWCCGTFEVRDGKIVLWRDRFDTAEVTLQLLTSPLRRVARQLGVLGRPGDGATAGSPRESHAPAGAPQRASA